MDWTVVSDLIITVLVLLQNHYIRLKWKIDRSSSI
jgi:hypothetical protein